MNAKELYKDLICKLQQVPQFVCTYLLSLCTRYSLTKGQGHSEVVHLLEDAHILVLSRRHFTTEVHKVRVCSYEHRCCALGFEELTERR